MKGIIDQFKKETGSILSDMGLKTKSGTVIGLDLGTGFFRAVRVRESAGEIPLKDTLVKENIELKNLTGQMNISPDESIVMNYTGGKLTINRVSLPFMPVQEIGEALKWELKEQFHIDIDRSKIKFSVLGEKQKEDGSRKIELMAVTYDERGIEEKVKELKSLGLNVQAVIPAEFALTAYVNHLKLISPGETAAIVDIGKAATTISVVEDKKLSFTRYIAIGGDNITEAMTGTLVSDKGKIELSKEEAEKIKREQGISDDTRIASMMRPVLEKFVIEIKRSMEYCGHRFGTGPLGKIILAGNGARLKGLKGYLSKETGIEVTDVLPEAAEAVGLALSADAGINILPEKFKEEKGKTIKRISLRMASITFALLLLFSYALLAARSANLKKELRIYRSHLETVRDIRAIRDEMLILGSAVNTVSSRSIGAGDVMKELSNIVPASVMLDNLAIKDTEPNLEISGIALKGEQLSEFMSLLEASPVFEKVQLVLSEENKDHSLSAVDFEIICNLTR